MKEVDEVEEAVEVVGVEKEEDDICIIKIHE